jgi:hypothetical protein
MSYLGPTPSHEALLALRGLAREVFQKLGGGEAFIRSERESFVEHTQRQLPAIQQPENE